MADNETIKKRAEEKVEKLKKLLETSSSFPYTKETITKESQFIRIRYWNGKPYKVNVFVKGNLGEIFTEIDSELVQFECYKCKKEFGMQFNGVRNVRFYCPHCKASYSRINNIVYLT